MRNEFMSRKITEAGQDKLDASRQEFSLLLDALDLLLPAGRAKSIVVTKLQEVSMFASLGIAEANEVSAKY